MVVTKDELAAGSTHWAQGGIASVQAVGDTVEQHVDDTLVAGAGLCIEEAVRVLVSEGPDEVAKLIARGAEFDRDPAGALALTREGGHHRNRIAHAGGDATGAEIERALVSAVTADPGHRDRQPRAGPRSAARRDRARRAAGRGRDHPARARRGHPRRRRRGARAGRGPGHRRHRPDLRRDHQPAGVHR